MTASFVPLRFVCDQRRRFQFTLATLMLFVTVLCVVLGWAYRPRPAQVEAVLIFNSHYAVAGNYRPTAGEPTNSIATQRRLLTSRPIIEAALMDPRCARLTFVQNKTDAVAWLQGELHDELQVEVVNNSEFMKVFLPANTAEAKQAQTLLASLLAAYLDAANREFWRKLQQRTKSVEVSIERSERRIAELSDEILELESKRDPAAPDVRLLKKLSVREQTRNQSFTVQLNLLRFRAAKGPPIKLLQAPTVVE